MIEDIASNPQGFHTQTSCPLEHHQGMHAYVKFSLFLLEQRRLGREPLQHQHVRDSYVLFTHCSHHIEVGPI